MRKFRKASEKFAPQFGGYCASGMAAAGKEVYACNPTVYTVENGKLIVFATQAELEKWQENPNEHYDAELRKSKALLTESAQENEAADSQG